MPGVAFFKSSSWRWDSRPGCRPRWSAETHIIMGSPPRASRPTSAAAGIVARGPPDDCDSDHGPLEQRDHPERHDAVLQRVRSTLRHHPARESLQRDARSMSLQHMCETCPTSFNRMFGRRIGAPKARNCVRIHKMLNSLITDERPLIPCKSDFCEVDAVDLNGETTVL